jgi:hypothetical protein
MSAQKTTTDYLVLCRGTSWYESLPPEEAQKMLAQFVVWYDRLCDEGKIKGGHVLGREGKVLTGRKGVTDGPFPESKEVVGGYWFVRAESLEEATKISQGNPCLDYGATYEIRPLVLDDPGLKLAREQVAAARR